ncbi:urease accessory protein UreD [Phormidium tenue FACHB-886]|nr:urease accessory protein UreD [Phormidium tenue FACHB-886]
MPNISSSPTRSSWQGQLSLDFTHQPPKTLLSRSQVQAPLKVQRPFYPEGESVCHTVMLHTAGGIVGGDRLSLDITLHPHAQALLTTATAAKIYRSNGPVAQQTTHLKVASGACLEWLPQETIVFDGAQYRQTLRVELAAEATWLGWEITRMGRTARGEQFTSGTWRSHTEVWQSDQLIWVDPQRIVGGSAMLQSPHGLGGCPVIGSFVFVGRSLCIDLLEKIRTLLVASPLEASPPPLPAQIAVTRLPAGLLCRYRGHSTLEARRWFIQIWQLLRLEYCERAACLPRVW